MAVGYFAKCDVCGKMEQLTKGDRCAIDYPGGWVRMRTGDSLIGSPDAQETVCCGWACVIAYADAMTSKV